MLSDEIKDQERITYKKYTFFIIIGIVLGAIGFKLKGWYADVLVIVGGLIVIISLHLLAAAVDIYYKIKGKLREEETGEPFKESYIVWPNWVNKYGAIIYWIIIFIGIGYFAEMHENDFGGLRFVLHSLLFGIFAGMVINNILKLRFTSWSSSRHKSLEITFYLIVSSIFLSICMGPVVNKYFADNKIECNSYTLLSNDKNYKKGSKYIRVQVGIKEERFSPPPAFFKQLSDKDSLVILCVRKGFFGYDYVEDFKLPE